MRNQPSNQEFNNRIRTYFGPEKKQLAAFIAFTDAVNAQEQLPAKADDTEKSKKEKREPKQKNDEQNE